MVGRILRPLYNTCTGYGVVRLPDNGRTLARERRGFMSLLCNKNRPRIIPNYTKQPHLVDGPMALYHENKICGLLSSCRCLAVGFGILAACPERVKVGPTHLCNYKGGEVWIPSPLDSGATRKAAASTNPSGASRFPRSHITCPLHSTPARRRSYSSPESQSPPKRAPSPRPRPSSLIQTRPPACSTREEDGARFYAPLLRSHARHLRSWLHYRSMGPCHPPL